MSLLTLMGASLRTGTETGMGLTDSAALALFLAGGASLAVAGYLLATAPRVQAARVPRRR